MAKPVAIAGHEFATQKEAQAYTRALMDKWYKKRREANLGPFATQEVKLEGEDLKFAEALLRRHPEYKEKLADARTRGARGICVAPNEYGGRSFHILTREKPLVAFSYLKCIRGK